jgi:GTP-binding protein
MLDAELMKEVKKTIPKNVPHVLISSHTQLGLQELKDMLWEAINS